MSTPLEIIWQMRYHCHERHSDQVCWLAKAWNSFFLISGTEALLALLGQVGTRCHNWHGTPWTYHSLAQHHVKMEKHCAVCCMLKRHQQGVTAPLLAWQQMQVGMTDLQPHRACWQQICRLSPHTWGRQEPPHPRLRAPHLLEDQLQHLCTNNSSSATCWYVSSPSPHKGHQGT